MKPGILGVFYSVEEQENSLTRDHENINDIIYMSKIK